VRRWPKTHMFSRSYGAEGGIVAAEAELSIAGSLGRLERRGTRIRDGGGAVRGVVVGEGRRVGTGRQFGGPGFWIVCRRVFGSTFYILRFRLLARAPFFFLSFLKSTYRVLLHHHSLTERNNNCLAYYYRRTIPIPLDRDNSEFTTQAHQHTAEQPHHRPQQT
jgi:hypothetical protein